MVPFAVHAFHFNSSRLLYAIAFPIRVKYVNILISWTYLITLQKVYEED
jgi:hypothetical protein